MTDKEIGKLYHQSQFVKTLPNNGQALNQWLDAAQNLIRKVVEERAWRLCWGAWCLCWFHNDSLDVPGPQLALMKKYIPIALRDFGIPKDQWSMVE